VEIVRASCVKKSGGLCVDFVRGFCVNISRGFYGFLREFLREFLRDFLRGFVVRGFFDKKHVPVLNAQKHPENDTFVWGRACVTKYSRTDFHAKYSCGNSHENSLVETGIFMQRFAHKFKRGKEKYSCKYSCGHFSLTHGPNRSATSCQVICCCYR
jgi:hypothetical protein